MIYIKKAIEEAVNGGYGYARWRTQFEERPDYFLDWTCEEYEELFSKEAVNKFLLDREFWRCLGVARGLGKKQGLIEGKKYIQNGKTVTRRLWLKQWHCFVDALADGKPAESFFEQLYSNKS